MQDIDVEFFSSLGERDILFIDSSHVVKIGSDVNYLFHEVFRDWHPAWLSKSTIFSCRNSAAKTGSRSMYRFWTEQDLLQSFLAFNSAFEVLLCNNYLGQRHYERMQATFPNSPGGAAAVFGCGGNRVAAAGL